MLRIIVLVTTLTAVNADSTLNSFSSSNDGFKPYDYGSRTPEKYSRGSTKYFVSTASSPGHINNLSNIYSSSIFSDVNQGENLSSQAAKNYENLDTSYLSDAQAPTTLSSYSRPYLSSSDYSSLSSQSDFTGSRSPQPGFSGRTDYEGSSVSDYTGAGSQQFTVGTSYRGSSVENYPGSQDTSSIRGFVSSNQASSPAATGFVASPSYSDPTSNRGVYTGSGFKALDSSGLRGYYPGSGTREFAGVGKLRGHVVSGKYPVYENVASDGYSGNEVEYSSNPVYSSGGYKRESYNSGVPLHAGFSGAGLNYLSGLKGAYPVAGLKAQSVIYPGPRESGPISIPFSGASHGGDGSRILVSGGSPNFASYSSSPALLQKGHGSYLLGSSGGPGKIIIMKDSSSSGSHFSGSTYPGSHMYSSSPIIGGSFKTTRGADFGSQGASFSYTPSFAGGSSPSYTSRFLTRGGSPYPAYMSAS